MVEHIALAYVRTERTFYLQHDNEVYCVIDVHFISNEKSDDPVLLEFFCDCSGLESFMGISDKRGKQLFCEGLRDGFKLVKTRGISILSGGIYGKERGKVQALCFTNAHCRTVLEVSLTVGCVIDQLTMHLNRSIKHRSLKRKA